MAVTNTDNQKIKLKKNIRKIHRLSANCNQDDGCPVKGVLAPAVDKWSIFCLYNLAYNEVLRFNKLKQYIPGISPRMLSVTLKKLESSGLVIRKIYPEVPPKVEYRLTSFGQQFSEKLIELNLWLYKKTPR